MDGDVAPSGDHAAPLVTGREASLRARLAGRSLVLVGLMGAGKSTVGRRLATRIGLPFKDADTEIEAAAGMSIAEIFASFGEAYFRDGERRVIGRLLEGEPILLATGGGAYMNAETRALIAARGVSVWLKADVDVLLKRVRKRATRPLLQAPDPRAVLEKLAIERYPIYAFADITVESRDLPHERIADEVAAALDAWLDVDRASA